MLDINDQNDTNDNNFVTKLFVVPALSLRDSFQTIETQIMASN